LLQDVTPNIIPALANINLKRLGFFIVLYLIDLYRVTNVGNKTPNRQGIYSLIS